jgi:stress-induced morphogen
LYSTSSDLEGAFIFSVMKQEKFLLMNNNSIRMMSTMIGKRYQAIQQTITNQFQPTHLEIIDESHKHSSHAAMKGLNATETHFRVEIVSEAFKGKKMLERHRMINEALAQEFAQGLHALSLKTKTPEEIANTQQQSQ